MKMTYNWLVAGMLAVAASTPVLGIAKYAVPSQQAPYLTGAQVEMGITVTDEMAYRILDEVVGALEAQMELSLSTDFLVSEYRAGKLAIQYVGFDGVVHVFQVTYGGGTLISSIEEI